MKNLIYENKSFLHYARIETDGESIIFSRKNISGTKNATVKLSDVERISADKGALSYCLRIDRKIGDPIIFGGLDKQAVEELKRNLGSLVEIRAAKDRQTINLEEARKGTAEILGKLGSDFDGRHLISYLINLGVQLDSSDIHITPKQDCALVQFRIDGLLQEIARMGSENYVRFLATLKNRAKLPSYKKSTPQDGSFHFEEGNLKLDVRCATIPTLFGEKLALRILNTAKTPLFLDDLGFSPEILSSYKKLLQEPQGCIILTGPAGSGKTTTIFASLIHIYNLFEGTVNIATIEDPAEYIIQEFQQTQVNPATGFTFAVGLKSLLRLDPDIIMVGEIRDPETAQTAVRTALTGHLIFSTLHARDSLGVFPRLAEMDIRPGMAASSVTAILYQRLVRKLCNKCKFPTDTPRELINAMKKRGFESGQYFTARGCPDCSGTGYSGRIGVFELLEVDEKIREMVTAGAPHSLMHDYCRQRGMKFLWDDALDKVRMGVTDIEEITRVCPREMKV